MCDAAANCSLVQRVINPVYTRNRAAPFEKNKKLGAKEKDAQADLFDDESDEEVAPAPAAAPATAMEDLFGDDDDDEVEEEEGAEEVVEETPAPAAAKPAASDRMAELCPKNRGAARRRAKSTMPRKRSEKRVARVSAKNERGPAPLCAGAIARVAQLRRRLGLRGRGGGGDGV